MKEKIANFFKNNKNAKEVWEANGKLFVCSGAARSYDPDVECHTRKSVSELKEDETDKEE